jgi:hypothetical protein
MSDFQITPEYIEQLKSRESLFSELAEAIDIEADLRDNKTILALMQAAKAGHDAALDEMMELSPLDTAAVARCLVNVKTFRYMKRALESVLSRGKRAEALIRAQDEHSQHE